MNNISLKEALQEFNKERDWDQFHTPENLAKSISIEAAELLECFQWDDEIELEEVCDEMADVYSYLVMLADRLDVDLDEIAFAKLQKNIEKYPAEKARGKSTKYDKL